MSHSVVAPCVFLVNYEYPPLGGGAGNATANMAREMAARGAAVHVITAAFAGLARDEETADGFRIHRIPTLRRRCDRSNVLEMLIFLLSSLLYVPWLARRYRPALIVAFFGIPSGPAAWLARALFGIPYVVSLRGGDVPGFACEGVALYHRLTGPLLRRLWRHATAVVANSDGLADLARRFAPEVTVDIIPNGVDTTVFAPADSLIMNDQGRPQTPGGLDGLGFRAHESAGPQRPNQSTQSHSLDGLALDAAERDGPMRLLFVGRLVEQKGVDVLLDALAAVTAADRPVLTLVGDGPQRPVLAAQAERLGLAASVRFHGWAGREAMPGLYRDADAFVLPSRDEGMPNVVLEAMAAGLPVIATRIAGSQELVADGETGLLVTVESADELAAAIDRLAGDRLAGDGGLCRRMGAAGRQRVEDRYGWGPVAAAYLRMIPRSRDR